MHWVKFYFAFSLCSTLSSSCSAVIPQEIDSASGKFTSHIQVHAHGSTDPVSYDRYWNDPGAMNEYINAGSLGRFQGFLACIIGAAFVIAGPEYISMTAGEAKNPRRSMPKAFTSITYRLVIFFIIGALSVGIVCPYTSDQLLGNTGSYAAASPYIISMEILGIDILPDIVNALILTSILSAANGYIFSKHSYSKTVSVSIRLLTTQLQLPLEHSYHWLYLARLLDS